MPSTPPASLGLRAQDGPPWAREHARNEDGDRFRKVHVNTIEGSGPLLRSWLRPHRGISQDKPPFHLGFLQFVRNARQRGKALLGTLIAGLVA